MISLDVKQRHILPKQQHSSTPLQQFKFEQGSSARNKQSIIGSSIFDAKYMYESCVGCMHSKRLKINGLEPKITADSTLFSVYAYIMGTQLYRHRSIPLI